MLRRGFRLSLILPRPEDPIPADQVRGRLLCLIMVRVIRARAVTVEGCVGRMVGIARNIRTRRRGMWV